LKSFDGGPSEHSFPQPSSDAATGRGVGGRSLHCNRWSETDSYPRAHWLTIDTVCKPNSIPFNSTGEKIRDGALWLVQEFAAQLDAILLWTGLRGAG
jgi:hypothetical protein